MVRLFALSVLSNALLASSFSVSSHNNVGCSLLTPASSSLQMTARPGDEVGEESSSASLQQAMNPTSRREVLQRTAASLLVGALPLGTQPQLSLAADDKGNDEGMISQSKLASLLNPVPTFAIVDPNGVPYFVVGEDAKLSSYFFLSYGEAKRILDVAIKSSDNAIKASKKEIKAKRGKITKEDEEEIGTNPWKSARITSVPLDLAVSLASKGKLAGGYFRLAPSESDIEDALAADGSDDLPEGKVPLFYVEDMTIANGDMRVEPLYFQKEQLMKELKKNQSALYKKESDIKVTELFATITEMVRPGGKDEELKKLQFVTPLDSKAKAEQCKKGEKEPFKLGERLIVL